MPLVSEAVDFGKHLSPLAWMRLLFAEWVVLAIVPADLKERYSELLAALGRSDAALADYFPQYRRSPD